MLLRRFGSVKAAKVILIAALRVIAFVGLLPLHNPGFAESVESPASVQFQLQWLSLTNGSIQINGLPWYTENAPDLWRLPRSAKATVPSRVWLRAIAPDGGRIRLATDSSCLVIRVEKKGPEKKRCFLDAYLDDVYAGSGEMPGGEVSEVTLFTNQTRALRQLTVYLPNNHEVRVLGLALDAAAKVEAPSPFAVKNPIVCYGSSVLQGTGAAHPGKTYPAILARHLKRDFVNLGFGGAGKAEPDVVNLVNQLEASAFLFDLGKSYGDQGIEPFSQMLASIRKKHPQTPIFCVTPIYSVKERTESGYQEKSEKLRALMRDAAETRKKFGDPAIFVIEGLDLFGPADENFFNDPLHPDAEGNERLARRLQARIEPILSGTTMPSNRPDVPRR